jgi:hypothetical protein
MLIISFPITRMMEQFGLSFKTQELKLGRPTALLWGTTAPVSLLARWASSLCLQMASFSTMETSMATFLLFNSALQACQPLHQVTFPRLMSRQWFPLSSFPSPLLRRPPRPLPQLLNQQRHPRLHQDLQLRLPVQSQLLVVRLP